MSYKYPFLAVEEKDKLLVWNKGLKVIYDGKELDPAIWRWDVCGNEIKFSEHGNTNSENGWEIDHIKPSALGGRNYLGNLQPLQWQNNRKKSDTYPWL